MSASETVLKVQIPASRIPYVASIEEVSWIEEYVQPTVHNDIAASIIKASDTRDNYWLTGNGQIVAVCDTGLDTGNKNTVHLDLRGRVLKIIDSKGDGSVADQSGHGTHVAGSVLGNGALSGGQYSGMAPEAKLVFQAAGDGTAYLALPDDLYEMFYEAYLLGARIHTNSWGVSSDGEYTDYSQDIDQFMWEHPDMLILFSAGNSGKDSNEDGVIDQNSIGSPGTAKNCLTIGASENERGDNFGITPYLTWGSGSWIYFFPVNPITNDYMANNREGIAAFSSRGPTNDNRTKPDLVAPGTFIVSTRSSQATGTGWGGIDNNYLYMGGTSMSTPITAGAAALTRQYYTDIEGLENPSAALIKATLINGAYDMTPGQYGTGSYQEVQRRPDNSQGWGRVDVENSLFPQNSVVLKYHDNLRLNDTGDSWNVTYSVNYSTEPFQATLVWTDYPASLPSSKALVNDLDLAVIGPAGPYLGNGGSEPDNTNNVECINIPTPAVGNYTIYVNAAKIHTQPEPQSFSLVLSFKEDNYITFQGITEDEVIQCNNPSINIKSHKYSDICYKIDSAVNSTMTRAYYLNTTLNLTDGSHNITVFAREMGGETISTAINFTVFTSQPAITSPASGTVYYLPDNTFNISGNAGIATNVSVYVNGEINNSYHPASNGAFNIDNIPLLNGINTVDITSILNYSNQKYFSNNTTIYLSVGEIFPAGGSDEAMLPVPGIGTVPYPLLNFNITGTSANPGSLAAAVVRGQDPCSGSTFTGPAIDIRVMNDSEPVSTYEFRKNVSLTLGYDPTFVGNADKLAIAWYDPVEENWTPFRSAVNSSAHTITTNITHLSVYAPVEDNTAPVITGLSSSRTTTSVTLAWKNSADADHVEIRRNGAPLTTTSGSTLTDSGLPPGTTCTYSLRAIDFVVNVGEWSNISVTTSQTSSPGSGGGGGGSSGESAENILFKDVLAVNTMKDTVTTFEFDNEVNDIQYIRYLSLKNSGKISTTIEVLKNTSGFAANAAPDLTYRNINIWVGKTGYATENNIMEPVIGFRVSQAWVLSNAIDPYTVKLNRYSGGAWEELATEQTGFDDNYLYFEAKTPGFSPFAITGKQFALARQGREPQELLLDLEGNMVSLTDDENNSDNTEKDMLSDTLLGLSGVALTCAYILRRRGQQN
ncbi:PGF-pre-PGF domain-containing protein [Methanolobus chelungpuianus]|uniref:PGF-pre-PGF domain-containing protein n=1 Tax=Methanolobus chelungpuianus TaxID=502115 RepID=UPI002114C4C0|nr:PGF-pre-PGF domain-containing protein [Methanolobus chelungpuianus]